MSHASERASIGTISRLRHLTEDVLGICGSLQDWVQADHYDYTHPDVFLVRQGDIFSVSVLHKIAMGRDGVTPFSSNKEVGWRVEQQTHGIPIV